MIPHLGGGGAERVMELLARELPQERFSIHLGILSAVQGAAVQLPRHVQVHPLHARRVRFASWRIITLVRRVKPQLIVSCMAHLNFLVLMLRSFYPGGVKIVVRQNGALPENNSGLAARAYRMLYPLADGIIAQSKAMADELCAALPVRRDLVQSLHNPIRFPVAAALPKSGSTAIQLLAVGRLVQEKGFDLLLQALSALRKQGFALQLTIVGQGPEHERLEKLAAQLSLQGAVSLIGYCENPFESINADIFVLSSRSEGMPNALLEAAAFSLPIVATPCSRGVADLLLNRPGTWMAEETSARALEKTIAAVVAQHRPGQKFRHEFIRPYECSVAVGAYAEYFSEVLRR